MSKTTGIVRKVDELGRIVLPKELRTTMGIDEGTPLEVYADRKTGEIILKVYQPGCVLCGTVTKDTTETFKGKIVCRDCRGQIIQSEAKKAERAPMWPEGKWR